LAGGQPGALLYLLKAMGCLALVLGLLILCLYGIRRWRPGMLRQAPGTQIRILDVCMLAPKKSLTLVEVAGEWLLLGVGSDAVTLLTRLEAVEQGERVQGTAIHRGFGKNLADFLQRKKEPGKPRECGNGLEKRLTTLK
jgi:flagellar biosynthetic protein FliO